MPSKPSKFTIPKTFGACADKLYALQEERAKLNRQAEAVEAHEKAIKAYLIEKLPKDDTGAAGHVARVEKYVKVVPRADDWDKIYDHIRKTGNFALLQKRLGETAIKEIWDENKNVPGIVSFQLYAISVKKV